MVEVQGAAPWSCSTYVTEIISDKIIYTSPGGGLSTNQSSGLKMSTGLSLALGSMMMEAGSLPV